MPELAIFAALTVPGITWLAGRLYEQRHWRKVADAAYRQVVDLRRTEIQLLTITRSQRHLLELMTDAAREVAREDGPVTEARHRLDWAAHRAATELL